MKKMKKVLFSMLLLFVGIFTVNADDTGISPATDITQWGSIVTDMTANIDGSNNCSVTIGTEEVDSFTVGNECIFTGLKTMDSEFLLVGRAGTDTVEGATYHGKIGTSTNNIADTNILLTEIVELIYNPNSAATKKVKAKGMSLYSSAKGYTLKAGSKDNALYVYGGVEGGTMSGIKLTFNQTSKALTYTITKSATNDDEFRLATAFTWYLVDYIMEASPNYDKAAEIVFNEDKFGKISANFASKYGTVIRTSSTPLKVDVNLNLLGTINNDVVSLYEAAIANPTPTPTPTPTPQPDPNGDNPNTGAFVNIFAIVALISVGTVLVLGNKRKLFRI